MTSIKRIRDGDPVPSGGRYLSTVREPDPDRATEEWVGDCLSGGLLGQLFGNRETLYRKTPIATFHYYEVTSL